MLTILPTKFWRRGGGTVVGMVLINITILFMEAISNGIRCQGFSFICLRAKGHSYVISGFQESLFGMDFEKNHFPHQVKTVSLSCCVLPK